MNEFCKGDDKGRCEERLQFLKDKSIGIGKKGVRPKAREDALIITEKLVYCNSERIWKFGVL